MRPLRLGQDTVLSWTAGAVECRVVAAAGEYVLLRPARGGDMACSSPSGPSALTYLDGMVPMGWDGHVEPAAFPGELRFRVNRFGRSADRRSAVRVPVFAEVKASWGPITVDGRLLDVSAGGLRFRHPGRLDRDTLVHVRADLADGILIDAHALARASEPGVTAVEFTAMHGSSAEEIGNWAVSVLRASLGGRG